MSEAPAIDATPQNLLVRFRVWLAWGIAIAALLYVGGSLYAGLEEVGSALGGFDWSLYVPVLALTVLNYGLRFWKWHYLVGRLGVRLPVKENLVIFASGLAMVISPGKAGELLKPWLVRARAGVPMAHTIPALVTERLTDGIACLALAAVSVSTYAGDRAVYVFVPIALVAAGLAVLSHKGLSLAILGVVRRLPVFSRIGDKLEEMYLAMRTCVAPVPLLLTVLASLVAWGGECVGYWLVFRGFGIDASLDVSTFLYAFATVAGGAMPGGLGVADGALVGGAMELVPGVTEATAVASALLIRVATLWFGVVIGALALLRAAALLEPRPGPQAEG
ncbi:MAG: lysylphosphatidylglycerol synthase transmembrane domain-containing protein [Pseudomonadota bacterium]|nr:lysylphosphatidylglycerol synthase transmembrane domain-containing protein [Pseudomonadota bacterium]